MIGENGKCTECHNILNGLDLSTRICHSCFAALIDIEPKKETVMSENEQYKTARGRPKKALVFNKPEPLLPPVRTVYCNICKKDKSATEFYDKRVVEKGKSGTCKKCDNKRRAVNNRRVNTNNKISESHELVPFVRSFLIDVLPGITSVSKIKQLTHDIIKVIVA